MPSAIEVEKQARDLMTPGIQNLIKNIKARLPTNWGFGIIFFEHSRTHAPTIWVSSTDHKTFVDVADAFVKSSRKAGKG